MISEGPGRLGEQARTVLDRHWREPGFSVPHADVYPVLFGWDSAFHVVIRTALGDLDRAHAELANLFAAQTPAGFVPHMAYHLDPDAAVALWGVAGRSTITQPPMYSHAIAQLVRVGSAPPAEVVAAAGRGLRWLVRNRRRADGLFEIVHPWESGMDDSPRWDGVEPGVDGGATAGGTADSPRWDGVEPGVDGGATAGGTADSPMWDGVEPGIDGGATSGGTADAPAWDVESWRVRKTALVGSLVLDDDGAAVANPGFAVGAAGFTALVGFNLAELADVTGDADLGRLADETFEALAPLLTADGVWRDGGGHASGARRTLDGLLPLLGIDHPDAAELLAAVVDPTGFGGGFGPAFVHRAEPTFRPAVYWRGSVWPQMTYLIRLAARRRGRADVATMLTAGLQAGATTSGLAEHWDADTGAGLGAVPLSWAGLAAVP